MLGLAARWTQQVVERKKTHKSNQLLDFLGDESHTVPIIPIKGVRLVVLSERRGRCLVCTKMRVLDYLGARAFVWYRGEESLVRPPPCRPVV